MNTTHSTFNNPLSLLDEFLAIIIEDAVQCCQQYSPRATLTRFIIAAREAQAEEKRMAEIATNRQSKKEARKEDKKGKKGAHSQRRNSSVSVERSDETAEQLRMAAEREAERLKETAKKEVERLKRRAQEEADSVLKEAKVTFHR